MEEHIAQFICRETNRHIAGMLGCPMIDCQVDFVPIIDERRRLVKGHVEEQRTMGRCFPGDRRIQIVPEDNWGVVLIHELLHIYKPDWDHKKIRAATKECVMVLKMRYPPVPPTGPGQHCSAPA